MMKFKIKGKCHKNIGLIPRSKVCKEMTLFWSRKMNMMTKFSTLKFLKNNFKGRRKFTLYETYLILNEWQGKGKWSMPNALKKQKIDMIL